MILRYNTCTVQLSAVTVEFNFAKSRSWLGLLTGINTQQLISCPTEKKGAEPCENECLGRFFFYQETVAENSTLAVGKLF